MNRPELVDSVDRVVASECGVHPEWMHQRIRKGEIVVARQLAQIILSFKRMTDAEIALAYGQGRSTIAKALSVISSQILLYKEVKEKALRVCFKLEIPTDDFFRYCRMTPK